MYIIFLSTWQVKALAQKLGAAQCTRPPRFTRTDTRRAWLVSENILPLQIYTAVGSHHTKAKNKTCVNIECPPHIHFHKASTKHVEMLSQCQNIEHATRILCSILYFERAIYRTQDEYKVIQNVKVRNQLLIISKEIKTYTSIYGNANTWRFRTRLQNLKVTMWTLHVPSANYLLRYESLLYLPPLWYYR